MLRILILALIVAAVLTVIISRLSRNFPPTAGTIAPAFTLPSQDGTPVSLTDYRGKWVVLYFYPKDQTPG